MIRGAGHISSGTLFVFNKTISTCILQQPEKADTANRKVSFKEDADRGQQQREMHSEAKERRNRAHPMRFLGAESRILF